MSSIRRSSFDMMDIEPNTRTIEIKEIKNDTSNINITANSCYIRIILINIIIFISLILLIIFLKIPKSKEENNDIKIHNQQNNTLNYIHIDKNYKRITPYDNEYYYVPIASTNDFHGVFFPLDEEFIYKNTTIKYKIGGIDFISKYISILKEEFGKGGMLYLDSGDYFFRPYTPKIFDGNLSIDFFNLIGLNATTLGNHEFLLKRKWIEEKINLAKYPTLINNVIEKNGNKKNIFGKNHKNSEIFNITLKNGDIIKIGVIGLVLNLDVDKKFYDVGMRYTWNNISFQNYDYNLEKEALNLRKKGANAIIILSHIGINCTKNEETLKLKLYNQSTIQPKCEDNSPIMKLMNSPEAKKGIFDAVIAGDIHNQAHIWINNIPIMVTNGKGKNLNIMYLPFRKMGDKYILVNKEIKIEGPLPSCEKIFMNKLNCEKLKDENDFLNSGKLVNYFWHNKKIQKDNLTNILYKKYYSKYLYLTKNSSFVFTGFNSTIEVNKLNEDNSLIEKLFLDVIKNITHSDLSILHKSMFIQSVSPGGISYENFMEIIPYSGLLCTVNITGNELIQIIKTVQKGKNSFHPTSGLRQFVKFKKQGIKEILNVEIYDKNNIINKIDENKIYKMASTDIILNEDSFDDFQQKNILNIINDKLKKNLVKCSNKELNEILYEYFKEKKIVNLNNIKRYNKERIVFVK